MGEVPRGKDLLDVEDVANRLGLVEATVWRWCREGRLPCIKMGRSWRVRPEALEEFIRRSERQITLEGELGSFLRVPDNILAIAQTPDFLRRLETAFLKVAEARDGLLVKFHRPDAASEEGLRDRLEGSGLDVRRLEKEGRFRLQTESPEGRADSVRRLLSEEADSRRTLWVCFEWDDAVDEETALRRRRELAEVTGSERLVVETTLPEEVANGWSAEMLRKVQALHSGTVWLSEDGLAISRVRPLPGL